MTSRSVYAARGRQQQQHSHNNNNNDEYNDNNNDSDSVNFSLRHLYDVLQLSAPVLLERATALLQQQPERAECAADDARAHTDTNDDDDNNNNNNNNSNNDQAARAAAAWRGERVATSCALPSTSLLFAAAERLDALSSHYAAARVQHHSNSNTNDDGSDATALPPQHDAQAVSTLSRLLTWYCLYTARVSGTRLTTAPPPPTPPHSSSSSSSAPSTSTCASGVATPQPSSSSSSRSSVHDWLGSRMTTTTGGGSGGGAAMAVDAQLSTQLFHAAVRAVVRFCDYGMAGRATTNNNKDDNHNSDKNNDNNNSDNNNDNNSDNNVDDNDDEVATRVRESVLYLFAAVLTRFADDAFNGAMYVPLLFPACDVYGSATTRRRRAGHPMLTPLLCDAHARVRVAAALALTALLRKLRVMLAHAEESAPQRSAFASMATQAGEMLLCLHDALHSSLAHDDDNDDACDDEARSSTQARLLAVYAAVVTVTPYTRCTRSLRVLLQTLRLPRLRQLLRGVASCAPHKHDDDDGAAAAAAQRAARTLLVRATQHAAMRPHFAALFDDDDDDSTHCATQPTTTTSAHAQCLLTDLLQSASHNDDDDVQSEEVWYCVVQLAQHTPRVLQRHFTRLLDASQRLLRVAVQLLRHEQQQPPPPHTAAMTTAADDGDDDRVVLSATTTTASVVRSRDTTRDAAAAMNALSQCLRAWLHFMGTVWLPFDVPQIQQQQQQQQQPQVQHYAHRPTCNDDDDDSSSNDDDTAHATLAQRAALHTRLFAPVMQQLHGSVAAADVCYAVLRCLAQLGDAYVRTCAHATTTTTATTSREALARYVLHAATRHWSARVRAEAMHTLGTWLWLYTAFDATHACVFVDTAVNALRHDGDAVVRCKAALALSNVTTRLVMRDGDDDNDDDDDEGDDRDDDSARCHRQRPHDAVATRRRVAPLPLRVLQQQQQSPPPSSSSSSPAAAVTSRLQMLCDVAMYAVVNGGGSDCGSSGDNNSSSRAAAAATVRSHGVRMMRYLLRALTYDELIAELSEHDEGVAEAFLRILTSQVRSRTVLTDSNNSNNSNNSRLSLAAQAKLRWNAAGALGDALSRDVVYEAEPVGALAATRALCDAVVHDRVYKVRTQAARALARLPARCVACRFSNEDLTPHIVHALCTALASCHNNNNNNNSRPAAVVMTTTTTGCVRQQRGEAQATLRAALRDAIVVWQTTAMPSAALTAVFASCRRVLSAEGLLQHMCSRIVDTLDVLWSVGQRLRVVYNASKSEQTRSRDRQRTAVRVAAFVTCALLFVALDGRDDALAVVCAALRHPLRAAHS